MHIVDKLALAAIVALGGAVARLALPVASWGLNVQAWALARLPPPGR